MPLAFMNTQAAPGAAFFLPLRNFLWMHSARESWRSPA